MTRPARGPRGTEAGDHNSQQRKRKPSREEEAAKRQRTGSATNDNDILGQQVVVNPEQTPTRSEHEPSQRPATPHPIQPPLSAAEGGNNDF